MPVEKPKAKITNIGTYNKETETLHNFRFKYDNGERGDGMVYAFDENGRQIVKSVCGWLPEELKEIAIANEQLSE